MRGGRRYSIIEQRSRSDAFFYSLVIMFVTRWQFPVFRGNIDAHSFHFANKKKPNKVRR